MEPAMPPFIAPVIGQITPCQQREFPPPPQVTSLCFAPLRLVGRRDKLTETVVEAGVARFMTSGHQAAIDFLSTRGIPLKTIARVLWRPRERRGL
jgi:hypothetical protein